MSDVESNPHHKSRYEIGQNLEDLSIDEIDHTIDLLNQEISRLQAIRELKNKHLNAAEALFAPKR